MSEVNTTFTRGDGITLRIRCKLGSAGFANLTGATFETHFPGQRAPVEIDDDAHTADPDQSANTGVVEITLTPAQTMQCREGDRLKGIIKATQNDVPMQFHFLMNIRSPKV